MEWLRVLLEKLGIADTEIDKIDAEVRKELPMHYVPKSQYNDVSDAKKQAEKDRDKLSGQLDELKKSEGATEALKAEITKLQGANQEAKDQYEADMKALRLDTAIKLAMNGQVHDADYALSQLNKEKIELSEDGSIKSGLEEQLKSLRESKGFLFTDGQENKPPRMRGFRPKDGGAPGGESSGGASEFAKAANETGKAPAAGPNPWG